MCAVWVALIGAVLAVSSASAIDGTYHGKGSDPGGYRWQLYAKIAPLPNGQYRTDVQSTNATCASQTESVGTLRGSILTVVGSCPLTIRFNGRLARIIEDKGCSEHGATCSFNGIVHKGR
jgi:hypothetical protein